MIERKNYTAVVYKTDRRTRTGQRLVLKRDHADIDLKTLQHLYRTTWLARDGYRCEFNETYVTRTNLQTGKEYSERYDTPGYCSPSSETYWSM